MDLYVTLFKLRHRFTRIYADLFKFNIVDFYHLSVLIKPFPGLRECGQSPQALICVNNLFFMEIG